MHFEEVINKYQSVPNTTREVKRDFDKLMLGFLKTYPQLQTRFLNFWLWEDFPYRDCMGIKDYGIDLVAETWEDHYWAIQCRYFQKEERITPKKIKTFLSKTSKRYRGMDRLISFELRLFISPTNNWSPKAEEMIRHIYPPCEKITLANLETAPVDWEQLDRGISGREARTEKKTPWKHQTEAVDAFHEHFKTQERGLLISPTGTGKTYTALKIAENETDGEGLVIYLAPSIGLIGQAIREWTAESEVRIIPICVFSKTNTRLTSINSQKDDPSYMGIENIGLRVCDSDIELLVELQLVQKYHQKDLCVIFCTYQSMDILAKTLKEMKIMANFMVCDEVHRTIANITLTDDDESYFIRSHYQSLIQAEKRLNMTAIPRIYGDDGRLKTTQYSAVTSSVDDALYFGEEVYRMEFSEALQENLISDYKVLLLTVKPPSNKPEELGKNKIPLKTNDRYKLIACVYALSKMMDLGSCILEDLDPGPMNKAVAFCSSIEKSKKISKIINNFKNNFYNKLDPKEREKLVKVSAGHVDATKIFSVLDKKISWLKNAKRGSQNCRILTNKRSLLEGVDTQSLDAAIFMSRNYSYDELDQSVRRIMSKEKGKNFGYIIIPIVISPDVPPKKVLNDKVTFKLVWDVLNVIKAHDDRFNSIINDIRFDENIPTGGGAVLIGGPSTCSKEESKKIIPNKHLPPLSENMVEYRAPIYAGMVKKLGNLSNMISWGTEVGGLAEDYIERFSYLVKKTGIAQDEFKTFLNDLRININPTINRHEAISMLAQHAATIPVFDALSNNCAFTKNNPVSQSFQRMEDIIKENFTDYDELCYSTFTQNDTKDILLNSTAIGKFITKTDNPDVKQKIYLDLYNNFFSVVFKDELEKFGVVNTPVELADFIINSIGQVLNKEFNMDISDENIHILDPFTGTGTLIARLLQSGLLTDSLKRKYTNELHANEMRLLPYYIAAINIENAFHTAFHSKYIDYQSFKGICLTDTFQLCEGDTKVSNSFKDNLERIKTQKNDHMMVILSTLPYFAGQMNEKDNRQNVKYPVLDKRITETYAQKSTADNKNCLYDTYIKAFRWATDRINENREQGGVIAFITNANWIDNHGMDGMRLYLADEFTSIYVLNLRGDKRNSGEILKKEADNVFGPGARPPVAITLLIKNPNHIGPCKIFYSAVADYMTTMDKLSFVQKSHDIYNEDLLWETISPNSMGDWINKRNEIYYSFIILGSKKNKASIKTCFSDFFCRGLSTGQDTWYYNYSKKYLSKNIKKWISNFNTKVEEYTANRKEFPSLKVDEFTHFSAKFYSWTDQQKSNFSKGKLYSYEKNALVESLYRPFQKQICYFENDLINYDYSLHQLFPTKNHSNLVICYGGPSEHKPYSFIMSNVLPDLYLLEAGILCFPLYYYHELTNGSDSEYPPDKLFDGYIRHDGISDYIFNECKLKYGSQLPDINKIQIFYYIYAILHCPEYKNTYALDLATIRPRIPLVKEAHDFEAFVKAGIALSKLHLDYEAVKPYSNVRVIGEQTGKFKVNKMRFDKGTNMKCDKSVIIYNNHIKITDIPLEAYNYVVDSKSAIEWVMERYQLKTDKFRKIHNDPNDWAIEHDDPRYILDLLLRIIRVSIETQEILESLPKLNF
ncbi:MAG: DEAD/DEAH box helicase family protein [Deltaproteobacteria bacterium]|jgi:predicted helicase|nr:DEAD/DEAH box helicase family protein [Deltaproteobacteria bacterium]